MTAVSGVRPTDSILDRIVADKKVPLEQRKRNEPAASFLPRIRDFDDQWSLGQAILKAREGFGGNGPCPIVAEIKKASPSKGRFVENLDHAAVARSYSQAGAIGISVVTEKNYFDGDIRWLRDIRLGLQTRLFGPRPALLRKDFLFDPYEIAQSRAYGADNILLIVAMLDNPLLRDLMAHAKAHLLEPLVEVHNEEEAERALNAGVTLFGINNRDLHTFAVDLSTTERIRPLLPKDAIVIGESGVNARSDVERLYQAGVSAILVGESLMTAPDVKVKMDELRL